MPIQLSEAIRRQLFAPQSTEAVLTLLTLNHSSFPAPIRIVNNSSDIVSRGNLFSAFPFRITLPADNGENARECTISIDNTSLELIGLLRSVTEEIPATIEIILGSLPNEVQIDFSDLTLRGIKYNKNQINANLTLDNFLNTEMTSEKYTPAKFRGLF